MLLPSQEGRAVSVHSYHSISHLCVTYSSLPFLLPSCNAIRTCCAVQSRPSHQVSDSLLAMGNCLAIEVREQPARYYGSDEPRHVVVRQKNKSAYRRSNEWSVYQPRSRPGTRRDDFRSQDDFGSFETQQTDYEEYYRSPSPAEYRRFEPLPPPVPPAPVIHNDHFPTNNPHDHGGIVNLGGHPPLDPNEILPIEQPPEIIRRSPRPPRGRRQIVVHSSRRGNSAGRYYDGSDGSSWDERGYRSGHSDDGWVEAYRPGRRHSSRRRSRSRNTSRYNT